MITWLFGLALAGGSGNPGVEASPPVDVAPLPDVTLAPGERVPGVALARAGLVSGYIGAPAMAVGSPMFVVGLFAGPEPAIFSGATLALGGATASVTGPILASVGQAKALDHLAGRGVVVPRTAKRVGDGMFVGGAATLGVSAIASFAGADGPLPVVGFIAGGASMVLSLIPYEVQQGLIVRGARGRSSVSLSVTPAGVTGRF